jgi:hypothetical protein
MRSLFVIAGACLLTAGCSLSPVEDRRVFVGDTQGMSDAAVAAVISESSVTVYLCGGASSLEHTHWFSGTIDAAGVITVEPRDGWTIDAKLVDYAIQGTIHAPDGATIPINGEPGARSPLENLYAVVDEGCRTGVVVKQASDNETPAVQGAWCNSAGRFMQVTPILPIQISERGLHVLVNTPEGMRDLWAAEFATPR